ncbi:dUTP diphosphatase [Wukongibacter baidiensis]|uniref:dUTP diphosphatase n=1 Tax=Wukongibacter baidiensis TaxID=1723361 RepID=UPI003D7F42CE
MGLRELFKSQEIIENRIKSLSDIEEDSIGKENIFDLKFLALQVKTSEIANITKCYKYYKLERKILKEEIISRYIDALKFILSIGNTNDFNIINEEAIRQTNRTDNVIKLFSSIFDDISTLRKSILRKEYVNSLSIYIKLFGKYVNLGECLGISFEEMYNYYMENNCIEKSEALVRFDRKTV